MRRPIGIFSALSLLLTVAVGPVAAAPQTVLEPIFLNWPDLNQGKVVFWNITREDLCEWEAGGFVGAPPVLELIPSTYNETPTGAVVASFKATAHIELWQLDADADLSGPCADTDDSTAPWATGTSQAAATDNDLFHFDSVQMGLYRSNAFGDRGQATLEDASGAAWHYSWVFHVVSDKHDEVVTFRDHSVLVPR